MLTTDPSVRNSIEMAKSSKEIHRLVFFFEGGGEFIEESVQKRKLTGRKGLTAAAIEIVSNYCQLIIGDGIKCLVIMVALKIEIR